MVHVGTVAILWATLRQWNQRGIVRQKTSRGKTLNHIAGVFLKPYRRGVIGIELVGSPPDFWLGAIKWVEYPYNSDSAENYDDQRTHW